MLGGSSSINAMIYIRGSRYDYDTWRDEYGCDGWGYTDLMPYFLRAEDNSRGESAFHGASGPLSVQDLRYKSSLTGAFVAAAQACGAPANDDFNGARQDGVGYYQVTQRGGRRWSAADAYLHPAAARPNLTIAHRRPGHRHRDRGRPGHRGALPAPRRRGGRRGRGGGHPGRRAPSAARSC